MNKLIWPVAILALALIIDLMIPLHKNAN